MDALGEVITTEKNNTNSFICYNKRITAHIKSIQNLCLKINIESKCGFIVLYNLTGHVDWLECSLRHSRENYNKSYICCQISYGNINTPKRMQDFSVKCENLIKELKEYL